jgi:uncharacterized protein (DUF2062 family)
LSQYFFRKFIKPIFTINDTPHSIALGVVLGVFVALTPTVGFQMITVAVIGTFIKANRIIAIILCWISNPITFIPMYYGYYWVGGKVLAVELWTFSNFSEKMNGVLAARESLGYVEAFKQLGSETLLPLFVGSLILATVFSIPLYPITMSALIKYRKRNGLDEMGQVPKKDDSGSSGDGDPCDCDAADKKEECATRSPKQDRETAEADPSSETPPEAAKDVNLQSAKKND